MGKNKISLDLQTITTTIITTITITTTIIVLGYSYPLPQTPLINVNLDVVGIPIGLPYLLSSIALRLHNTDNVYTKIIILLLKYYYYYNNYYYRRTCDKYT